MALFRSSHSKQAEEDARLERELRGIIQLFLRVTSELKTVRTAIDECDRVIDSFGERLTQQRAARTEKYGKKFQHMVCSTESPGFSFEYFDVLGQAGWELVAATTYSVGSSGMLTSHAHYVFKRELLDIPEAELAELAKGLKSAQGERGRLEPELKKLVEYREQILDRAKAADPASVAFLERKVAPSEQAQSSADTPVSIRHYSGV